MSVVITNVTPDGLTDKEGIATYIVRINREPPLARFTHRREDGLAACLRRAAEAVALNETVREIVEWGRASAKAYRDLPSGGREASLIEALFDEIERRDFHKKTGEAGE